MPSCKFWFDKDN